MNGITQNERWNTKDKDYEYQELMFEGAGGGGAADDIMISGWGAENTNPPQNTGQKGKAVGLRNNKLKMMVKKLSSNNYLQYAVT